MTLTTAEEIDFFQNLEIHKDTIEALHNVFHNAQGNITTWTTSRDMIPVDILLEYLGIDRTPFVRKCFDVAEHDHIGAIDFLQFSQTVYKFCPAGKPELIEFILVIYDPDKNGVLWLEEMVSFLEDQYGGAAGVSENLGAIKIKLALQQMFKNSDFSDGGLDKKQLYDFIVKYPRLLYPAIQFQNQLKHDVLGIRYWDQWSNRNKPSFLKRLMMRLKISKKGDTTDEEKNGGGDSTNQGGEDGEDEDGDGEEEGETGETTKRARGGTGLQKFMKTGKASKSSDDKKGGKWNSGRSRALNFGGSKDKKTNETNDGDGEVVDELGENAAGEEMLGVLQEERARAQAAANKTTQEGDDKEEAVVPEPTLAPIANVETTGGGTSAVAAARERRKTRDTNREGASSRLSRLGREGSARSPQARSPAKIAAGVVDDALDPMSRGMEKPTIIVQSDTVLGVNGLKPQKTTRVSATSRSSEGSRRGTSSSPSRSPSARVPASLRAASLRRQPSSLSSHSNTTDSEAIPSGHDPSGAAVTANDSSPLHRHIAEFTISEAPSGQQPQRTTISSSGYHPTGRSPSRGNSEKRLTRQASVNSSGRSRIPTTSPRRITSGAPRRQTALFRQPSNLTQEGESVHSGGGGDTGGDSPMRGPPSQVHQHALASASAVSPQRRPTSTAGRGSVFSIGLKNRGVDLRHGARAPVTTLRKESSVASIHSESGSAISPRRTQRPASHAGPISRRGGTAAEAGSRSPSAKSPPESERVPTAQSPLARLRSTTVAVGDQESELGFQRLSVDDKVAGSPSPSTEDVGRVSSRKKNERDGAGRGGKLLTDLESFDVSSRNSGGKPDRMSGVVVAGVQFSDGEEDADQGDEQRITFKKKPAGVAK